MHNKNLYIETMTRSTENLENTGINVAGTTPLKKQRVTEALQKSQKKKE